MMFFEGPDFTNSAQDVFEDAAGEILAYAQSNAPWSDRTGDAREGLGVEVTHTFGVVTLELFHTVDYGKWLETIQNGQFAVIMPTLERFAPQVFNEVGGAIAISNSGEDYSL